jgi:hypothetical protein
MSIGPRIGVACPAPGERAALADWLRDAGFEPVAMFNEISVARELDQHAFEVLIVDRELISAGVLELMRKRGIRRPLIIIGDDCTADAGETPRDASRVSRPLSRDVLMLAVSLALAEGRPARRSPRMSVPGLSASIDGVPAQILDVSNEGLRLELSEQHRGSVPPFFTLRVPAFNIVLVAQRVWVASSPVAGRLWCGAALEPKAASTLGWRAMLETAGTSFRNTPARAPAPAAAASSPNVKASQTLLPRSLTAWLERGLQAVQRSGW